MAARKVHGIVPELADAATPISKLKPYPGNPRRGNVELLVESLKKHGQYAVVTVDRRSGQILTGNHTVQAAKKLGWTHVAVAYVDANDPGVAARIVLGDNRHADVAGYNEAQLVELLQWVPDLDGTGFAEDDLRRLAARLEARPLFDEPLEKLGNGHERISGADIAPRILAGWFAFTLTDSAAFIDWANSVVVQVGQEGIDAELRKRLRLPGKPESRRRKTTERTTDMPDSARVEPEEGNGVHRVKLDELKPYSRNARRGDVNLIHESLQINGQYRPLVVNRRTMEVLKGNHTMQAARKAGWDTLLCTFVDVDEVEAAEIVLMDNRASDVAVYDTEALADLMVRVGLPAGTGWSDSDWLAFLHDMGRARDDTASKAVGYVRIEYFPANVKWAVGCDGADYRQWFEELLRQGRYSEDGVRAEILNRLELA